MNKFLYRHVFISLGYIAKSEIAGSYDNSVSNFLRNLQIHPSLDSLISMALNAPSVPLSCTRAALAAFSEFSQLSHLRVLNSWILKEPNACDYLVGLALVIRENSDPSQAFSLRQDVVPLTLTPCSRYL